HHRRTQTRLRRNINPARPPTRRRPWIPLPSNPTTDDPMTKPPKPPTPNQESNMALDSNTPTTRSRRGFAAMDPERSREIARKGGASVPGEKRSFAKDRDLAASAGRKGGEASRGGGRSRSREPNV